MKQSLTIIYLLCLSALPFFTLAQGTQSVQLQGNFSTQFAVLMKDDALKLTDKNQAVQGTLFVNTALHVHSKHSDNVVDQYNTVWFAAKTLVKFDAKGCVTEGTILYASLFPKPARDAGNAVTTNLPISFQANTVIKLNSKGQVTQGTLKTNTNLTNTQKVNKSYTAGTEVKFNADGLVIVEAEKPVAKNEPEKPAGNGGSGKKYGFSILSSHDAPDGRYCYGDCYYYISKVVDLTSLPGVGQHNTAYEYEQALAKWFESKITLRNGSAFSYICQGDILVKGCVYRAGFRRTDGTGEGFLSGCSGKEDACFYFNQAEVEAIRQKSITELTPNHQNGHGGDCGGEVVE